MVGPGDAMTLFASRCRRLAWCCAAASTEHTCTATEPGCLRADRTGVPAGRMDHSDHGQANADRRVRFNGLALPGHQEIGWRQALETVVVGLATNCHRFHCGQSHRDRPHPQLAQPPPQPPQEGCRGLQQSLNLTRPLRSRILTRVAGGWLHVEHGFYDPLALPCHRFIFLEYVSRPARIQVSLLVQELHSCRTFPAARTPFQRCIQDAGLLLKEQIEIVNHFCAIIQNSHKMSS